MASAFTLNDAVSGSHVSVRLSKEPTDQASSPKLTLFVDWVYAEDKTKDKTGYRLHVVLTETKPIGARQPETKWMLVHPSPSDPRRTPFCRQNELAKSLLALLTTPTSGEAASLASWLKEMGCGEQDMSAQGTNINQIATDFVEEFKFVPPVTTGSAFATAKLPSDDEAADDRPTTRAVVDGQGAIPASAKPAAAAASRPDSGAVAANAAPVIPDGAPLSLPKADGQPVRPPAKAAAAQADAAASASSEPRGRSRHQEALAAAGKDAAASGDDSEVASLRSRLARLEAALIEGQRQQRGSSQPPASKLGNYRVMAGTRTADAGAALTKVHLVGSAAHRDGGSKKGKTAMFKVPCFAQAHMTLLTSIKTGTGGQEGRLYTTQRGNTAWNTGITARFITLHGGDTGVLVRLSGPDFFFIEKDDRLMLVSE